ncbi:MAG: hypothetical protein WA459_20695 [Stellaceae bacterium]
MVVLAAGRIVTLAHPVWFYLLVLLGSMVIRIIMAGVRIAEHKDEMRNGHPINLRYDLLSPDYLVPFVIGTSELTVYPFLISLGAWQGIIGWLGVKTAAKWRWERNQDREGYTNFLLGNALAVAAGFPLASLITS